MRRLGEPFERVRRKTDFSKLGMRLLGRIRHQRPDTLQHLHRAFDGVDAVPWPAAVRLLTAHDDLNIDSSFIAELDFRRAVDDGPFGADIAVREDMRERIVAPGLARRADDEKEISRKF